MLRRLILSVVASAGVILAALTCALASEAGAAGSFAAPRLSFSPDQIRLAEAVAGTPELAAFYGENGLQPIFQGPQSAIRRIALIDAIGTAAQHGLPPARYGANQLAARHDSGADQPEDELLFARAFMRWTREVSGGLLDPRKADPNSQRVVLRTSADRLLHRFQSAPDPAAMLAGLPPQDPRYKVLQAALRDGAALIAPADLAKVDAGVWRLADDAPAVAHLRARLAAVGFASKPPQGRESLFDDGLRIALQDYQARIGLEADGIAGPQTIAAINRSEMSARRDIILSLERMRWLAGHDLGARHVWVNLPQFSAEIRENGEKQFETRVVVGKEGDSYRTPEFSDEIEYMVVNPRWNVPRSITVREYLPRLQANRHAVSHLDVVDGNGNVVPRDRIDFGRYTAKTFPYRMRQKPGDDNALGLVKFMFPNPWNIYLHDTPTKHLFNQSSRAYSHGCIRIGKPFELAYQLLRDTVPDPQGHFRRALDGKRETWLHLGKFVPVHLVYFTAFPDDSGQIRHYRDIYRRDPIILAAFERAALEIFPWDG